MLNNKVILITGGTGTLGRKCTKIILERYRPKKLIIFSRDELKQYEMSQVFSLNKYPSIRYFIGDVRDIERLHRAFYDVDYIIHAAALKQVSAAEYNPFESVKTNVIGSQNIINAAIDQKVKKVVAVSTDKAVSPINLYGATKLCAEKIFIAGNSYVGEGDTEFSVVRFGNFIGSSGSVIQTFLKQKKEGLLTLTDPRMTRFWISQGQAVEFLLFSLGKMVGGEVFIPKLPSMNIDDLADIIAPDCKKDIIGIRPGEKLHEAMISKDEARLTLEYDNYYILQPCFNYFKDRFSPDVGRPVPSDYEYNSDTNPWWFNKEDLLESLKEFNS